ncbi:MAG TPA: PHP domain-containing protein [Desulfobulbus sp.]|nr:PHP domain-containing protein [Desulfobulbus sp.]
MAVICTLRKGDAVITVNSDPSNLPPQDDRLFRSIPGPWKQYRADATAPGRSLCRVSCPGRRSPRGGLKPVSAMCIDLHFHSVFSDGTALPRELARMAADLRLTAIALTDHDTMAGVPEMMEHGRAAGIEVIPGIEIGALHRGRSLHLLGYGIEAGHRQFNDWLARLQQGRTERNRAILEKLGCMGIRISEKELQRFSRCGQVGRPHIAALLMEKGIVRSMDQAFSLYLGRGKPAWQSRFCYSAAETIAMIHRAGGLAVLAHPGQLDPAMRIQPRLVAELKELRLDGLEAWYPAHPRKMRRALAALASRHGLLVTGGSDFHGANRPGSSLAGGDNGFCPPDELLNGLLPRLMPGREPATGGRAAMGAA